MGESAGPSAAGPGVPARRRAPRLRVLIAAFDGLQPSQVRPGLTPTIHRLARDGVTFARHHAVFPTVTRVNAASMVTGRHPGGHGLLGNTLVVPEWEPHRAIPALAPELGAIAEAMGRVLLAPTLGEMLRPHALTFGTVVGGTSGNAYVQHPRAGRVGGAVLHPEFTLPADHYAPMVERFGAWPPKRSPDIGRIRQVADVLLGYLLPEVDPDVGAGVVPGTGHVAARGRRRLPAGHRGADRRRRRARSDSGGARTPWRRARCPGRVRPRVLDRRPSNPDRGRRPGGRVSARACARRRDRGRERWGGAFLRARFGPRRPRAVDRVARRAALDGRSRRRAGGGGGARAASR